MGQAAFAPSRLCSAALEGDCSRLAGAAKKVHGPNMAAGEEMAL
jgi:hypothetical protein